MKTKRNLIQICLLGALLLPAAAQAQFAYTTNSDNTITITNYTGTGGAVTIPPTINGLTVSGIGDEAFFSKSSLTSVTIPDSVINIGVAAFESCINLAGVVIGNNVKAIGFGAFYDCIKLLNVTISSRVTSIGEGAFGDCTSLTAITADPANPVYSSVNGVLFNKSQTLLVEYPGSLAGAYSIPAGVNSIGGWAFAACQNLSGVTISSSVTNIGEYAFYGCPDLTGITIPNNVTGIAQLAFYGCPKLNGIYFLGNAPVSAINIFQLDVATVYYAAGTTGWGATYDGLPAVLSYPNLVANGNFETGDFSGWTFLSSLGYDNTIVANPHSGLYAAQFHKNTGSLADVVMSQTLPTQSNEVYVLSLWVNGISNGGGLVDWNGQELVNESFSSGWTHLQFLVTATSTSTVLKFVTVYDTTAVDDVSVVPLVNYNQITARLANSGGMQLSFQGNLNANYALDRTFNLLPPIDWTPQSTNITDANGVLLLTNTPVSTTNNFWRIRSVP